MCSVQCYLYNLFVSDALTSVLRKKTSICKSNKWFEKPERKRKIDFVNEEEPEAKKIKL